MLLYVTVAIVAYTFGFFTCALMVVAKRSDLDAEKSSNT